MTCCQVTDRCPLGYLPSHSKTHKSAFVVKTSEATGISESTVFNIRKEKKETCQLASTKINQRTNGPVNAHLISWPTKAQNIQNLENIW